MLVYGQMEDVKSSKMLEMNCNFPFINLHYSALLIGAVPIAHCQEVSFAKLLIQTAGQAKPLC